MGSQEKLLSGNYDSIAPLFQSSAMKLVLTKTVFAIKCLFVLMLNVPVNNFSVMSRRSHRILCIISTFRGVNVYYHKMCRLIYKFGVNNISSYNLQA